MAAFRRSRGFPHKFENNVDKELKINHRSVKNKSERKKKRNGEIGRRKNYNYCWRRHNWVAMRCRLLIPVGYRAIDRLSFSFLNSSECRTRPVALRMATCSGSAVIQYGVHWNPVHCNLISNPIISSGEPTTFSFANIFVAVSLQNYKDLFEFAKIMDEMRF